MHIVHVLPLAHRLRPAVCYLQCQLPVAVRSAGNADVAPHPRPDCRSGGCGKMVEHGTVPRRRDSCCSCHDPCSRRRRPAVRQHPTTIGHRVLETVRETHRMETHVDLIDVFYMSARLRYLCASVLLS